MALKKPTKEVNRWTYIVCAFTLCATSFTAYSRFVDTEQRRVIKERSVGAELVSYECSVGKSEQYPAWRSKIAALTGKPFFQEQKRIYKDSLGSFEKVDVDFVGEITAKKSIGNGCKSSI